MLYKKEYKLLKKLSDKPLPLDKFSEEDQALSEDLFARGLVKLWANRNDEVFLYYVSLTQKGLIEMTNYKKKSTFWTAFGVIISLLTLLATLLVGFHDLLLQ